MLFHGRAIFIFVCIFLVQFLHGILLWRLASLAHPHRKTLTVFVGSLAFVCLFSAEQYSTFTWSFQIQFVAVYFAVTGALSSLMIFASLPADGLLTEERRRRLWLALTLFIAILATYSMANGLMVWPVLLLEAFWFGLSRRVKLILLATAAVIWALYFRGYKTPLQTSSIREGFHHATQSFAFAMCVLGSPLNGMVSQIDRIFSIGSENSQLVWTATGGLVGFVAAAFLWVTFIRNRRDTNRADAVVLHLMLFLVGTVCLIGLGRVNFSLSAALQSRYTTPALLFWFCIIFLVSSRLSKASSTADSQSLLLFQFVATMAVLLLIVLYQPTQIRVESAAALYVSESEAAISAPVWLYRFRPPGCAGHPTHHRSRRRMDCVHSGGESRFCCGLYGDGRRQRSLPGGNSRSGIPLEYAGGRSADVQDKSASSKESRQGTNTFPAPEGVIDHTVIGHEYRIMTKPWHSPNLFSTTSWQSMSGCIIVERLALGR